MRVLENLIPLLVQNYTIFALVHFILAFQNKIFISQKLFTYQKCINLVEMFHFFLPETCACLFFKKLYYELLKKLLKAFLNEI